MSEKGLDGLTQEKREERFWQIFQRLCGVDPVIHLNPEDRENTLRWYRERVAADGSMRPEVKSS